MKRLLRILRVLAGAAALAAAAWWTLEAIAKRSGPPRYGLDEGRPTGLRISPLTPVEAGVARALERDELMAWLNDRPG